MPPSLTTTPAASPQMQADTAEELLQVDDTDFAASISVPEQPVIQVAEEPTSLKRRRSSSSSSSSSSESSASEEDEEEDSSSSDEEGNVIPTTVANLSNRHLSHYWSSSDSDSDSDAPSTRRQSSSPSAVSNSYAYMHKRQIEETLLNKITNQLQPDKLPGILSILSSETSTTQQTDEVEIDLSGLEREKLVCLLSYVDACIVEQNGGPAVNVADYIIKKQETKKKGPRTRPALRDTDDDDDDDDDDNDSRPRRGRRSQQRKPRRRVAKSRQELTEEILADDDEEEEQAAVPRPAPSLSQSMSGQRQGPMSMASLSRRQDKESKKLSRKNGANRKRSRRSKRSKDDDDAAVVSSSSSALAFAQSIDSIAVSRPKRRAALHKRRLLEDALLPSDGEESGPCEEGTLIVYSDEQMDFGVTDNKTIVHEPSTTPAINSTPLPQLPVPDDDDDDVDEEIDIML